MIQRVSKNYLLVLTACLLGSILAEAANRSPETITNGPRHSRLVYPGPDGKLIYKATTNGDRLPDFSHAGYGGGGLKIPNTPVRETIAPSGQDDRNIIQAAIDKISNSDPNQQGIRGAVLLKSGSFKVKGTLHIWQSGVVLRGSVGTKITHTAPDGIKGASVSLVRVAPKSLNAKRQNHKHFVVSETRQPILDEYAPLGTRRVTVGSSIGYNIGDAIVVVRKSTAKWINAIGMDTIPERKDGRRITQWKPGKFDIPYYRYIRAIKGNSIELDAPLFHSIDREYGPGYVEKLDLTSVLKNVGIENIEAVSLGASFFSPEAHPWIMINMQNVFDSWVHNVTARKYAHALIRTGIFTRGITISRSRYLEPESGLTGRRRYPFHLQGQLHLGVNLYAENGRHDFVTGRQWSSGVVFLDSRSVHTNTVSEPHHRYSTGILYDNVRIDKPITAGLVLGLWNRNNMGTGHGWAAANSVLWNCIAGAGVAVEKPPLAQNYAIGVRSPQMAGDAAGSTHGAGDNFDPRGAHWEWWNHGPVMPRSLYRAQLKDRLGKSALAVLGSPLSVKP